MIFVYNKYFIILHRDKYKDRFCKFKEQEKIKILKFLM